MVDQLAWDDPAAALARSRRVARWIKGDIDLTEADARRTQVMARYLRAKGCDDDTIWCAVQIMDCPY